MFSQTTTVYLKFNVEKKNNTKISRSCAPLVSTTS